jgi:hypothetical protein
MHAPILFEFPVDSHSNSMVKHRIGQHPEAQDGPDSLLLLIQTLQMRTSRTSKGLGLREVNTVHLHMHAKELYQFAISGQI